MSALLQTLVSRPRIAGFGIPKIQAILAVYNSRRALARLDQAHLADVGLTPDQARAEAARAPWDLPANWRISA